MQHRDKTITGQPKSIRPDQLITTSDLVDFKFELLKDIKYICKNLAAQNKKSWIKSYEVRKLLGISPGTLQSLRDNGTIPFTRIGKIIFYNTADIDLMMEKLKNRNY